MSAPPPDPWYKDGLRFACTACGDCCTGAPGYVWVDDAEIARLAEHMHLEPVDFERRYVRRVGARRSLLERATGACVFFDESARRCRVYPARPTQCRTWPFWPENVSSPERWAEVEQGCPGSGQGALVPLAAIRRSLGGGPGRE
ncbi:MAG: YkgJ family cysteine cluster protein [Polyangiaceae bacterium]|nr:YkgJ family cysteine cluster protein [Polyangiaceae bacterium]